MANTRRRVAAAMSATVAAGVMLGGSPGQAATDWQIRTKIVPKDSHCSITGIERVLRRIGPANVLAGSPSADTTFRDFKRAVGRPEEVDKVSAGGVSASYLGGHAGTFLFVSFGQVQHRGDLRLQTATLTGRRWVTEKGVRVGSRLARVKQRYGRQAYPVDDPTRKGTWWRLAGHCGYPLVDGPIEVIEARIKHGRVAAFGLWIGAAGD